MKSWLVRALFRLLLTVIFCLAVACSEESPLGPEIDPLVGKWVGTFISPFDGSSTSNSLTLTVPTGGRATGAGHMWKTINDVPISESIYFEVDVSPDGSLVGTGRWLFDVYVSGVEGIYGEGTVLGSLDAATGTGSGELRMIFIDGMVTVSWEVTREGGS